MDLSPLLVWLARNRSIQHLALGKNFSSIKSKWVLRGDAGVARWG